MAYWLMKSEPSVYSWDRLVKDGKTAWNGVRNHQANNNMKAMRLGDKAFFYHSNEDRCVVGVMKIIGLWRPDPEDDSGKFGMVEVAPLAPVAKPISLAQIKGDPRLAAMAFVRQGRLSVSPVTAEEWEIVTEMGQ